MSKLRVCPHGYGHCLCGPGPCPAHLRNVAKNGWTKEIRDKAKRDLESGGRYND